ncbi:MAG: hypothetical protein AAF565_13155, partial [Pseudomonadota bacterium]
MTNETAKISDAELNAFCDGELSDSESQRVAGAIEADPELRAKMAQIMGDIANLRAASEREEIDPATAALASRLGGAIERR